MIDLPRTSTAIESGIGIHHRGAQLFVARGDTVLADRAFGDMQPETRALWMSSVKPLVAVAVARLRERGELDWDDPVARHLPEFGEAGKQAVTLRHLLSHTGGFRGPHASWKPAELVDIVARICAARLEPDWVPGEKAGYHPDTSWYILGELVRRLDGRPVDRLLREDVFHPLGMDNSFLGIPESEQDERVGPMYEAVSGGLKPKSALNHPWVVALVRPGGNGRGPARELGLFYQALLAGGGGVIAPETVAEMTRRHREGMYDHTFRHILDFGLGFIVNGNRYGAETIPYGYGRHASDGAFGHSGSQSSAAFADPEHRLAVALVFNGMPGEPAHQRRMRDCLTALYEDLGLATPAP